MHLQSDDWHWGLLQAEYLPVASASSHMLIGLQEQVTPQKAYSVASAIFYSLRGLQRSAKFQGRGHRPLLLNKNVSVM